MTKLKNLAACLITLHTAMNVTKDEKTGKVLNAQPGEKFDLLPAGPAVSVPVDRLHPGQKKWLEHLVETGQVVEVGGGDEDENGDIYSEMNREELEATATGLGVSFKANTSDANLIKAIRAKS